MKRVVLSTPRARRDLIEIGTAIAQDSLRAADAVLAEIDNQSRLLARLPRLGRKRDELASGLRSFVVGSYVVFCWIVKNGVEIVRVLHGARDIASQFH